MDNSNNRRAEKRLCYQRPIWFAENFNSVLKQGQMVDVSSSEAAFTCYSNDCPHVGQNIKARFSVPEYGQDSSFDIVNFIRDGKVCRVDKVSPFLHKVAIQFAQPLSFQPGEQAHDHFQANPQQLAMTI